jgi:hypothetical protein
MRRQRYRYGKISGDPWTWENRQDLKGGLNRRSARGSHRGRDCGHEIQVGWGVNRARRLRGISELAPERFERRQGWKAFSSASISPVTTGLTQRAEAVSGPRSRK